MDDTGNVLMAHCYIRWRWPRVWRGLKSHSHQGSAVSLLRKINQVSIFRLCQLQRRVTLPESSMGKSVCIYNVSTTLTPSISAFTLRFSREVLAATDGIEDLGAPQWHLCLCLVLSTIVTFIALIKGVKSSGKVRTQILPEPPRNGKGRGTANSMRARHQ